LILGWNWRATIIAQQLDAHVAPGSSLTVAAEHDHVAADVEQLSHSLHRQTIQFHAADIGNRTVLESLRIRDYDHVILLCYSDTLDNHRADALSLLTLLHLRDIADKTGHTFSIVSEMMDMHDRALVESSRADDFIVSDRLISLLMAQVSENRSLNSLFHELLNPGGVNICLKPMVEYVLPGVQVAFYTVVTAACARGEVAIGYRIHAQAASSQHNYGIVVNPDKSATMAYAVHDRVIVLARS
jgi:hypothetical protein